MSGLQSLLSEVCGVPTKSHQSLCVLISLPVQLDLHLCGSIMALGAFVLPAIQRSSGAGEFQRKGFPIRMDLSAVWCQSCLCWQNSPHAREGSAGEFLWNQVEFLICGTHWEGIFCLFPHCWSTLSHTLPLFVFLSLLDQKEGLITLIAFSKALKSYIKCC